jgi:hypothetical protein
VIADTPKEWIEAIVLYLENDEKRKEVEVNAEKLAYASYENTAVTKKYIDLFERVKSNKKATS